MYVVMSGKGKIRVGSEESPVQARSVVFVDAFVPHKFFDQGFWGRRNNPDAERNIARLLQAWRSAKKPAVHIQHNSVMPRSPLRPDQPGNAFKPEAQLLPGEPIFGKTVNSAFIGTELEKYLREQEVNALVIAGLTTDHCVSTTTRIAGNLRFEVCLVGDACATFAKKAPDGTVIAAEEVHRINLASLHGEFCTVSSTAEVLSEEPA